MPALGSEISRAEKHGDFVGALSHGCGRRAFVVIAGNKNKIGALINDRLNDGLRNEAALSLPNGRTVDSKNNCLCVACGRHRDGNGDRVRIGRILDSLVINGTQAAPLAGNEQWLVMHHRLAREALDNSF
jgi:hypothetical protein